MKCVGVSKVDIIIQIGTDEQKEGIRQELEVIEKVTQEIGLLDDFRQIIVASDFESTVNALEGIDTYRATRGIDQGVNAIARVTKMPDGYAIVLSPLIYTKAHDSQTRFFVFFHELSHLINKKRFSSIPEDNRANSAYLHSLYFLFDEYDSDRFAISLCEQSFKEKSEFWEAFITSEILGFRDFIKDRRYYDSLLAEINSFRDHASVDVFLKNTQPYWDPMAIHLAHFFAFVHEYPDRALVSDVLDSPFVNAKTLALMHYFEIKENNHIADLSDGIEVITDFMTNFGMRFEPQGEGLYYHVLDI